MIKPLHCFMWAMNIHPVTDELQKIKSDKIIVKYTKHPKVMDVITNEFRKRKEYTHIVIHCCDMIATDEDFQKLKSRVEETGHSVLSGVCNVDTKKYINHLVICKYLPTLDYYQRIYRWIPESQRKWFIEHGHEIIPVKFAGYPLSFISREIFEKVNGLNTGPKNIPEKVRAMWIDAGGYANDLSFCHKCDEQGIEVFVDLTVKMLHLRYGAKVLAGNLFKYLP